MEPALKVEVTSYGWDYVRLDCGHTVPVDHEDEPDTLVGAETTCDKSHKEGN